MATLTAANSVITLSIAGVFPAPQQLQGFDVDDVFSTEAVAPAETKMGVDGILSGGWVPTEKKVTYTLQADSASNEVFDAWNDFQQQTQEAAIAQGNVFLPGLNRIYTKTRGFLTGYTAIADVKKLVQPRKFIITWQSITRIPV